MLKASNISISVVVLFGVAATSTSAHGVLRTYDGFNYSAGSVLNTASGGTGWASPWRELPPTIVAAQGLSYTHGQTLLTSPGAVGAASNGTAGRAQRLLATPVNTGEVWFSVLVACAPQRNELTFAYVGLQGAGGPNSHYGVSLARPSTTSNVFVGALSSRSSPQTALTSTTVASGNTALLVARLQMRSGSDSLSLWLNPRLDAPAPAPDVTLATTDLISFGALTLELASRGSAQADELRIGDTFADVTPVPTPACSLALGLYYVAVVRSRTRTT
jgi:hypothetical protein